MERWIRRYGAPKTVLLVCNTANDYFDNVQGWEGERMPGIGAAIDKHEYILPKNPNLLGQLVRKFVWNLRLFALYNSNSRWKLHQHPLILPQQKWLFINNLSTEAQVGNQSTQFAVGGLYKLATRHDFDINCFIWRDLRIEKLENLDVEIAKKRLGKLSNIDQDIFLTVTNNLDSMLSKKKWGEVWLHPHTEHASIEAIEIIAKLTYDKILNKTCYQIMSADASYGDSLC